MRLPFFSRTPLADAGALYAAVIAEARRPEWYRDLGAQDTLDGRFGVLTTLLALTDIRLERGADVAKGLGPRLTEAFIADMDVQMREHGFGDPSLGKQVRMMVGSLASKVERWRLAVEAIEPWDAVARTSLYRESIPDEDIALKGIEATRQWWRRLQETPDSELVAGTVR